ncbi:MAG: hypothetical protein RI955_1992 [Bacteroidota bacterium]|jgi:hypothetical protein
MPENQNINYNGLLNQAFDLVKKRIVFVLIAAAIAFAIGWYYKGLLPTKYSAKSTFYPDKEATLSGSPLELINGNTAARGGALAILAKVLNSHLMTEYIAARKVDTSFHLPYKYLADWIIDDNNSKLMPWAEKVDFRKLSEKERIRRGANSLRSDCFAVLDESGFMSLINNSYSSDLALYENQSIIDELITFNFNKKTEKAKNDLIYITHRADSVKELYENVKYQFAEFDDQNKFIIKKTVGIPKEDLEERKRIISARYLKLVDLQEQAFVRYQTDKPIVEILDHPYIDGVTTPSKMSSAILYAIFASIMTILFIVRNLLVSVISSEIAKATSKKKEEPLSQATPDSVL